MKKVILPTLILLASCANSSVDRTNLTEILAKCKGHAVVVAAGENDGNMKAYRHYLLICDSEANCYEYVGAKYMVSVGDTLKK
jgi:hypothetical protein